MNIAEAVLVRVFIKTKDMHRAAPRYAAMGSARAQAQAVGREVVGQPWIEGDLGGEQVDLVWVAVVTDTDHQGGLLTTADARSAAAVTSRVIPPAGDRSASTRGSSMSLCGAMTASNPVPSATRGTLDARGPVLVAADDALTKALLTLSTSSPGSTIVDGDDDERAQASWWLGRVWGRRAGRAVLAFGHGGHYTGTGAYTFTRWEQREYEWPRQWRQVLDDALNESATIDIYVSVLLHRAGASGRTKDTVLPGALAWADVDGEWTATRQQALDKLGVKSWQVSSGARGGRHVYVPVGESLDRQQLEGINRRLAVALGADDGWSCTKVLRLPGTWNHKPRAAGSASVPVRWVW